VKPMESYLAADRRRRLGGVVQGFDRVGGEPILTRLAADGLATMVRRPGAHANGRCRALRGICLEVVRNDIAGFGWPAVAGVASRDGLRRRELSSELRYTVTVPADTPFIRAISWRGLAKARRGGAADISPSRDRASAIIHAIALWPVTLRAQLRRALVERNCARWLLLPNDLSTSRCLPTEPLRSVLQCHRPEDVERGEARWRLKT